MSEMESTLPAGVLARLGARRGLLTLRVMLLVLAIGLVPLSAGAVVLRHESMVRQQEEQDASLGNAAAAQSASLENYFARARSVILITAQNPAFADFYALPGSRIERIRRGGPAVARLDAALGYLERLYPGSIGEACFIDRSGAENARVVRGVRARLADLSLAEASTPFFAPTFALGVGQVYQAKPYISPDTGEWVISNSTPMPSADGVKRAIVHFEVTIESFRRAAATAARFPLLVVDARTGHVVFDSRLRQRLGAPLGRPQDQRFELLAGRTGAGFLDIDGQRVAYHALRSSAGNANRWLAVSLAPPGDSSLLGGNGLPLALLVLALSLIALAVARRWVRVNADLDESQEGLRAGERRYRELFKEAEAARLALADQNDELRELDRLKDEFVALVSHELRTPLTSIRGYLELVTEAPDGLTAEQRQFLGVVERNAERLLRLVGDLLFVAQVDAGKFQLRPEEVDLAELAAASVESARPAAAARGVEIDLAAEAAPRIQGDVARLAQLLDNLVSNAIKFTSAGGRVEVSVSREGDDALLAVADSGVGIPEREQARLFERFYRTTAATQKAVQGTGLGLAITKAIVEAHHGAIAFTSSEGAGTTFRVTLPLTLAGGG
jgi:signal transduction histidine kinase